MGFSALSRFVYCLSGTDWSCWLFWVELSCIVSGSVITRVLAWPNSQFNSMHVRWPFRRPLNPVCLDHPSWLVQSVLHIAASVFGTDKVLRSTATWVNSNIQATVFPDDVSSHIPAFAIVHSIYILGRMCILVWFCCVSQFVTWYRWFVLWHLTTVASYLVASQYVWTRDDMV